MKFIKILIAIFLISTAVFSVCGDKICEESEYKTCRDCALINQNNVCETYEDAQSTHDPDCENAGGCYGPDSEQYLYDGGRGINCWPGKCNTGSCDNSCTVDSDCSSAFCTNSICTNLCLQDSSESNLNCTKEGAEVITPIRSAIYTRGATHVIFNVSGTGSAIVQASGPCDLEYEANIDLTLKTAPVIVKITNCDFKGMGSIRLNTSDSSGVIHFLSFPVFKYEAGEIPTRSTGHVSLASTMNGIPVEVKIWLG